MMEFYRNKVAVITGAASGIGRALAIDLAGRGAHLALSDVDEQGLAATRHACGFAPVFTRRLDVTSKEEVYQHAHDVEREFGTADLVFNNAGATVVGTIEHLTIEEIDWQLRVNLWGVIYGTKAFLPGMLARRQGWIVNVSSVFGLVGFPAQGAYNISKFGVRGLTECLWSELAGTGVHAVCVHPGGIRTNIDKACRSHHRGPMEERFADMAGKLLQTPPEVAAAEILDGVARGRKRILTGNRASTLGWLARLLPERYPALMNKWA